MVNHQVVTNFPATAQPVNGHQPLISYNVSTGHARVFCDTCGWFGEGRPRRWHGKVETEWRNHAGNIAMGVKLTHGEALNGCWCSECGRATRLAGEAAAKARG